MKKSWDLDKGRLKNGCLGKAGLLRQGPVMAGHDLSWRQETTPKTLHPHNRH